AAHGRALEGEARGAARGLPRHESAVRGTRRGAAQTQGAAARREPEPDPQPLRDDRSAARVLPQVRAVARHVPRAGAAGGDPGRPQSELVNPGRRAPRPMATLAAGDRPVRPLPIRARRAHGRLPTAIAARIALVLATLCGCTAGDRDGDGAAEAAASPEGGFPRVVALPGGASLRLERPPQRVLAANTAVVDTLTRLVAPERVAALCEQAFTW